MSRLVVLMLIIGLTLTSIWYGPNKMLARAEDGLPFFNLPRTVEVYSHILMEIDLGQVNPFNFARVTLYQLASWLNLLLNSNTATQQLIFGLFIVIPGISVWKLTKILLPNHTKEVETITGLLYLFNLFVLSQVLQRFIYPLIMLWSYLPLFLYFWIRWLDTQKVSYLFYFLASNFIFSGVYVLPSSVFALWIPAGILWLRRRKFWPAIMAAFLWLVTTSWWWYPQVMLKDSPYRDYLNVSRSITSMQDVSKYYPNSDIWLLKQRYFFAPETLWFNFFSAKPIQLISQGLVGLLVVGALTALIQRRGRLLIFWLLAGWFLVKGTNLPWGTEFYTSLFKIFPFTMVLRNPYEKLGVVFLLPYSMLAALGISRLPSKMARTLVVFIISLVLLRPLWTGQVFAGYQVEVPAAYAQANKFLNSQGNLRLLQLPFLFGAGTAYNWGYAGEEPANFLFDRPSLSNTYFAPTDPYLFLYQYLRLPRVYRFFQLLALDTIVLHRDSLPGPGYQENYEGSRAYVEKIENVSLDKSFGDLDIYRLDPDLPVDWGYTSNRVVSVPSLAAGFDLVVNNDSFNPHSDIFVVSPSLPSLTATSRPNYTITKLSPVHYRFQISQASAPYVLVLSVNFNQAWQARIDGQSLTNHFQVNGYANGWLVDKPGNYTVDVVFKVWPWD